MTLSLGERVGTAAWRRTEALRPGRTRSLGRRRRRLLESLHSRRADLLYAKRKLRICVTKSQLPSLHGPGLPRGENVLSGRATATRSLGPLDTHVQTQGTQHGEHFPRLDRRFPILELREPLPALTPARDAASACVSPTFWRSWRTAAIPGGSTNYDAIRTFYDLSNSTSDSILFEVCAVNLVPGGSVYVEPTMSATTPLRSNTVMYAARQLRSPTCELPRVGYAGNSLAARPASAASVEAGVAQSRPIARKRSFRSTPTSKPTVAN